MKEKLADLAENEALSVANSTDVLYLHWDCNIDWKVDPLQQFLLTAKYFFTNFEAYLAFGFTLFRKRAGLHTLQSFAQHSEPRLQHWQLPFATRDRLFAWAIEALSFGAKNPGELLSKRGFQVLWRFQPDLAVNVYLMLQLRRCSPGLLVGRLACRLAVPPIDVVKNLKSFLRLVPRWLRRSLYQPVA